MLRTRFSARSAARSARRREVAKRAHVDAKCTWRLQSSGFRPHPCAGAAITRPQSGREPRPTSACAGRRVCFVELTAFETHQPEFNQVNLFFRRRTRLLQAVLGTAPAGFSAFVMKDRRAASIKAAPRQRALSLGAKQPSLGSGLTAVRRERRDFDLQGHRNPQICRNISRLSLLCRALIESGGHLRAVLCDSFHRALRRWRNPAAEGWFLQDTLRTCEAASMDDSRLQASHRRRFT